MKLIPTCTITKGRYIKILMPKQSGKFNLRTLHRCKFMQEKRNSDTYTNVLNAQTLTKRLKNWCSGKAGNLNFELAE